MAEIFLEAWGEMCPLPLLKAEKELKQLKPGDSLVLETDHSCTARTFENWARKHQVVLEVEEVECGVWQIRITVPGTNGIGPTGQAQ
ncbi:MULTISPECIES: sulfurtransferase TusA family protein [Carboxydocella]|uniref:TusA-related sulfurtransferase n=2 Tax=Carboxydocella TaxID=178898 RepID=A0A1T4NR72_9FIRM|nr:MULTISPECIES: sulfurtransferase TusA family protein [Carboxydocella]AVX20221.1 TusA-related sulfurtransferase [Carboxydocella thermautotrophica]AVX30639.1 TusA-related sulfurtransferase [Carboxydocella thermautotrophica]SJZ81704.1 TusA-related sulfurtransferase [Carboxydocella sporoproducens DSM 16521]GAW28366.1 Sulfurtransferase TusA [Carboxydocella sp. ULO1]GAW31055.1 Sulfurtransferase TusA [Carboxydocella sp. JDF658]